MHEIMCKDHLLHFITLSLTDSKKNKTFCLAWLKVLADLCDMCLASMMYDNVCCPDELLHVLCEVLMHFEQVYTVPYDSFSAQSLEINWRCLAVKS